MRATDIIARKRDGEELTTEEIRWFVEGFTRGEIPDYQAAAWLMAVYLRGMTRRETFDLTQVMAESGDQLDLSEVIPYAVDKHSTGGVGDKVSLVVLPVVAALGIPVAKMSGRGLGFSGGTLDKLESIAGFQVSLTDEAFLQQVRDHGIVLAGQTKSLAPADGAIYALRDVTATVSSLPLIASSIMSKKLAGGSNAIVLDVKVGIGAFMHDLDEARELAQIMVDIGTQAGREMVALLSDMNQPLGGTVGNALEVREALEALHGGGPADLRDHCVTVAGHMIRLGRQDARENALDEAMAAAADALDNGRALDKFRELVVAQGGDAAVIDDPSRLPQASIIEPLPVSSDGYLAEVNALKVAMATLELGAGRAKKGDPIDPAVGVEVHGKVGDRVTAGAPIFTIHGNSEAAVERARALLQEATRISEQPQQPLPTFYGTIYGS